MKPHFRLSYPHKKNLHQTIYLEVSYGSSQESEYFYLISYLIFLALLLIYLSIS